MGDFSVIKWGPLGRSEWGLRAECDTPISNRSQFIPLGYLLVAFLGQTKRISKADRERFISGSLE